MDDEHLNQCHDAQGEDDGHGRSQGGGEAGRQSHDQRLCLRHVLSGILTLTSTFIYLWAIFTSLGDPDSPLGPCTSRLGGERQEVGKVVLGPQSQG